LEHDHPIEVSEQRKLGRSQASQQQSLGHCYRIV